MTPYTIENTRAKNLILILSTENFRDLRCVTLTVNP